MVVGVLVGLGLIGVVFVGLVLLVLFSPSDTPTPPATTTSPPPPPIPPAPPDDAGGSAALVPLSGRGRVAVVGESHYQPALCNVTHGAVADDHRAGALPAVAVLVPEPRNRHDRNAVRVEVDGRKVGYLSRDAAVGYQPVLRTLARSGQRAGVAPRSPAAAGAATASCCVWGPRTGCCWPPPV